MNALDHIEKIREAVCCLNGTHTGKRNQAFTSIDELSALFSRPMKTAEEWANQFPNLSVLLQKGDKEEAESFIRSIQQDAIASNSPQASALHAQTASLNKQAEPSDAKERGAIDLSLHNETEQEEALRLPAEDGQAMGDYGPVCDERVSHVVDVLFDQKWGRTLTRDGVIDLLNTTFAVKSTANTPSIDLRKLAEETAQSCFNLSGTSLMADTIYAAFVKLLEGK